MSNVLYFIQKMMDEKKDRHNYKLDYNEVFKDIVKMQHNKKKRKEGKLGVLLSLDDVARKYNVTREAINYLMKSYGFKKRKATEQKK